MIKQLIAGIKRYLTTTHFERCWDIIDEYRKHSKWNEDEFQRKCLECPDTKDIDDHALECAYYVWRNRKNSK